MSNECEKTYSPGEIVSGFSARGKRIAQLEADLASAKGEVEKCESELILAQKREMFDIAEIERLRGALRRYGDHHLSCLSEEPYDMKTCTCGWLKLKADLLKEK